MAERSIRGWVKQLIEEASAGQQRRIRALEAEVAKLDLQNNRMKEAMRRCLTCDYRLEILAQRRDQPAGVQLAGAKPPVSSEG